MVGKRDLQKYKTSAMAAILLCVQLAFVKANASTMTVTSIDNMRILVACPSQVDVLEGMYRDIKWTEFAERDLLLFSLTDTELQMISIPARGPISERDAKQVIRMSNCRADDKYVLIGKDGGVKRRWNGQIDVEDLFQTIDAMPMRQFEMKTRDVN